MKKKVVLVLTLMMLVALVACGGKSGTQQTAQQNAILGRWEIKEGKDSSWFYERFELFSDGTSVTSAGYQEKWISENGRLKIGDDVWSYTLSDNKLTISLLSTTLPRSRSVYVLRASNNHFLRPM